MISLARHALFSLLLAGIAELPAQPVEGLPEPAAPVRLAVPVPVQSTLANGLRVIVAERPALPLLSATLLLRRGAEADPEKSPGLASFTAGLLTQGTRTRSATQLAQEIEALGAELKAAASWDESTIELRCLSANAEPALALLAEIAQEPSFPLSEVERLRRQSLDDLRVALEEPRTVGRTAIARVLLGRGLYAHPSGGTPRSLAKIQRAEIVRFHATHYRPDEAQLILAGNLPPAAAFALAEKLFGGWSASSRPPAAEPPPFSPASQPRVILIDQPKAGQAAVFVGAPAISRQAGDYYAALVANAVLGGGYTSWLNQEIRVRRGLSYGARSTLLPLRAGGTFVAGCQTKNESAVEVAQILRAQFARLGEESADPAFFAARQSVLTGDLARDLETNAGWVRQLADLAAFGLPLDELNRAPDAIRAVTPALAQAFARTCLAPPRLSTVIVGQAAVIATPLRAAFPEVEIIPQRALDLESTTLRTSTRR